MRRHKTRTGYHLMLAWMLGFTIPWCIVAQDAPAKPEASKEKTGFTGRWKLVLLPFGEDTFAIFEVQGPDKVEVIDLFRRFLGDREIKYDHKADQLTLRLEGRFGKDTFQGRGDAQSVADGKVLGSVSLRGSHYPAWLERTTEDKVGQPGPSPVMASIQQVSRLPAKERVAKLEALLKQHAGKPMMQQAYTSLLPLTGTADLSAEQGAAHLEQWLKDAAVFGPEWSKTVRGNALRAIKANKALGAQALKLAREAEEALPANATAEQKVAAATDLATAAQSAGNLEVAKQAAARAQKLETVLDEEYHKNVPPFKPTPFAGRDKDADRVVLLELFTGAQCPPCVAADVAFDALLKSYKPSEIVALQYHLHIPGLDPLTNVDSENRALYYTVNSTPNIVFNGKKATPSGGGMTAAQGKFNEYSAVINEWMSKKKLADIQLQVDRKGEVINIKVNATVLPDPESKDGALASLGGSLRLALVEKEVKYVGGNRLRFHHHVVRALPTGADGTQINNGKCQVETVVDLAKLRASLAAYLEKRNFDNAQKATVTLKDLAVVAMVQDDADKQVLHAVMASVPTTP